MSEGGDFWSRRRAAVAEENRAEARAIEAKAEADTQAALEEKSDAEILEELELPDPETLELGDDVTGFMARTVPERIRRRALRRLWRLNPVLANVDGLVDYGEDYTDAALVIEGLQTTYQVGKGMLAHVEEMARQAEAEAEAEAEAAAEAEAEAGTEAESPPEEIATADDDPQGAEEAHAASPPAPAQDDTGDAAPASTTFVAERPRRMRFAFETPPSKIDVATGTP